VAEILELAQLAQPDRVADVHVRAARVKALFEPQLAPALELVAQRGLDDHLGHAARQ
jgi:hypothetical protein